eukprot:s2280_g9.t1
MLIVCGAVRRQHFLLSLVAMSLGALVAVGGRYIMDAPRWVSLLGLFVAITGAAQTVCFLVQLQMYGWREAKVICYACNFCGSQYPSFEEASAHEQTCPYGTNAAVPVGSSLSITGMVLRAPPSRLTLPCSMSQQHRVVDPRRQNPRPVSAYAPPAACSRSPVVPASPQCADRPYMQLGRGGGRATVGHQYAASADACAQGRGRVMQSVSLTPGANPRTLSPQGQPTNAYPAPARAASLEQGALPGPPRGGSSQAPWLGRVEEDAGPPPAPGPERLSDLEVSEN